MSSVVGRSSSVLPLTAEAAAGRRRASHDKIACPEVRAAMGDAPLASACLAQLERHFGPEALRPRSTLVKDWAADPLTATARDRIAGGHPHPSAAPWITGVWQQRLLLCGSETSAVEPGFMAGAVNAARRAAGAIVRRLVAEAGDGPG